MTGGYELDGDRLVLGHLASTMMLCVDGMETEAAYFAALGQVTGWSISGETLVLRGGRPGRDVRVRLPPLAGGRGCPQLGRRWTHRAERHYRLPVVMTTITHGEAHMTSAELGAGTRALPPNIERRALALWPRLDARALRRCHRDPARIARLVARRTTLSFETIVGMLSMPSVSPQDIETWFG
ncbi:MAG: META domain-containing protein [Chloroflexota bacterium]